MYLPPLMSPWPVGQQGGLHRRAAHTLQYQNTLGNLDLSLAYILGNGTSDLDYGYNGALRYTFDLGNAGKLAPVVAYQQTKAPRAVTADPNADEYRFAGIGAYLGSAPSIARISPRWPCRQ